MKFTQKTIQILKNFAAINPAIQFRKGNVLATVSSGYTIVGIAKLDQEIEQDFAIHDLNRFLGALSLFNAPDIQFHKNYLTIKDAGKELNYVFTDPSVILKIPETELPDIAAKVTVTASVLADITKALSIMSLPQLAFVGDGEDISVQAIDISNPTSDTFKITNLGKTDKVFKAVFKVENMKIIPGDYEVTIASEIVAEFKGNIVDYYLALEGESKM